MSNNVSRTRKITRSLLALLFGFGATWVAFGASDSANTDEERGTLLGAVDFGSVCRSLHGEQAEAIHLRFDAYGWGCFFRNDRVYQRKEIDMDEACELLYDGAVYAQSFDLDVAYSWECFRGPPP